MHNYLRENISHEENIEGAPGSDPEDQPSNQLIPLLANRNRTSKCAFKIREEFSNYFNGPGSISWQLETVKKGKY